VGGLLRETLEDAPLEMERRRAATERALDAVGEGQLRQERPLAGAGARPDMVVDPAPGVGIESIVHVVEEEGHDLSAGQLLQISLLGAVLSESLPEAGEPGHGAQPPLTLGWMYPISVA